MTEKDLTVVVKGAYTQVKLSEIPEREIWTDTGHMFYFRIENIAISFTDAGFMILSNRKPSEIYVTHKVCDPIRVRFEK